MGKKNRSLVFLVSHWSLVSVVSLFSEKFVKCVSIGKIKSKIGVNFLIKVQVSNKDKSKVMIF